MPNYDKIAVIFKSKNKEIYEWVVKESENLDMSMSAFILRILKEKKSKDHGDE
jgi:hypothetical protein